MLGQVADILARSIPNFCMLDFMTSEAFKVRGENVTKQDMVWNIRLPKAYRKPDSLMCSDGVNDILLALVAYHKVSTVASWNVRGTVKAQIAFPPCGKASLSSQGNTYRLRMTWALDMP